MKIEHELFLNNEMIILKTVCFKKMNITTKPIEKN